MKPFILKEKTPEVGYYLSGLFSTKPAAGEIGLEIECEGNHFRKTDLPKHWKYVKDNSLRGQDNAEYILKKPIRFEEVPEALKSLWDMFKIDGTVLDQSNRTSVHVHLNVQKFRMNRLTAFLALYYSLEELLTEYCGDHRVGNLFCLRAKDAPALVSQLRKFILTESGNVFSEGTHYAGLNAGAIIKLGSVEIRTLRGATDEETILGWVGILQRLYTLSGEFKDPRSIPGMLSGGGAMDYLHTVLGEDCTKVLLDGVSFTYDQIRESLYEGIRIAQDLCYCRDWSRFVESDVESDPFGRSLKDLATPSLLNTLSDLMSYQQSFSLQPISNSNPAAAIFEEDPEEDNEDYEPEYDDTTEADTEF